MAHLTCVVLADDEIVQPLSERTVEAAIALIRDAFPYEDGAESPEVYLRASLDKAAYESALEESGISDITYWTAIDKNSGEVIGNTGLYTYQADRSEASWLGWTAVAKSHRGRGLGKALIGVMINRARSEGKAYLRIWTSTHPNEAIANGYYSRLGFVDFRNREPMQGTTWDRRYLQLKMNRHASAKTAGID